MVAYNTVPLSEDARLNEPKAPQNRKALIALVAAVCFASACAGAVAPSPGRSVGTYVRLRRYLRSLWSLRPYVRSHWQLEPTEAT